MELQPTAKQSKTQDMMKLTILAAAAVATAAHKHAHHVHPEPKLQPMRAPVEAIPFDLSSVTLLPGGRFEVMTTRNLEFMLNLDDTRLACLYTSAANLTGTFNNPTCEPYAHPQYWGHYFGHFLSASAQMWATTGNTSIRDKGAVAVATLAQVQAAWTAIGQVGYVFPYSMVAWDNLFSNPPQNCAPVCVPFYVYHKVLAGMLDQYNLAGNTQALSVAIGMGRWVNEAVNGVIVNGGQALWQQVLGTEWGGMNDAMYNLYSITNDPEFLATARLFNHWVWTAPLAVNEDVLPGNHANTHIPEIIGEARGYELTGNATEYAIASNFFSIVNGSHSFATGGSNDHEYWGAADSMGDQMDDQTEESCTQYNILKVSRHLFQWSASALHADFYERALFNGLLGNQNREAPFDTPEATGFIYMLPLGGAGITKQWGASNDGFPCCWGTLSETFSKLGDSIFFSSADNSTLFVNLFASASVSWAAQGVLVTQTSAFPYATDKTTELVVSTSTSVNFTLAVRVPYWATTGNNSILINGVPFATGAALTPSTYVSITRTWAEADTVTVTYPATLRFEQLNDNRAQWQGVGALMYGGILLAGITNTQYAAIDMVNPSSSITRVGDDTQLLFNLTTPSICSSQLNVIQLMPLMDVMLQAYTVYWHTNVPPPIGYNASGVSTVPGLGDSFSVSGGASITPNGGDTNIRSGNQYEVNLVKYSTAVQDATHAITGLNFTYQYVSGYGPAGKHVGTNFTLVARDVCADTDVMTLYQSPELVDYPYDVCNTCYSPPVVVYLPPGSFNLNVHNVTQFAMRFYDNDRNLQLLLPMDLTLYWN